MWQFICSHPLTGSAQTVLALIGTWSLAWGLKSIRESGGFDTTKPAPLSWRFWAGLALITVGALPSVFGPLACVEPREARALDSRMVIDLFVGIAMVSLTTALVGATFRYARATDRMLDQMRRQDRPLLYLFYEDIRDDVGGRPFYHLALRNVGNRMAHHIQLRAIEDAFIGTEFEGKREFIYVSNTRPFLQGIPNLLPGDRFVIGFYASSLFSERRSEQKLVYQVNYKDGADLYYEETATIAYKLS